MAHKGNLIHGIATEQQQAREIEQESGTPMRRIMSGRGFVDYS
jgi:hypothetical protein